MPDPVFDYNLAFSRNIGWLTADEQQILRFKKVAIAGLGGVGGNHLITLTRLGVGQFNISDFDRYDIPNFNRQIGASMATVGQQKLDVLSDQAKAINPELILNSFPEGVNLENVDVFLDGVDLYVDSLDFFVLDIRRLIFAKCADKGIPAITAAPLGMGCAFLAFLPGKMTFEDYFRLEGHNEQEQLLRFLVGLGPRALHNNYLVYPKAIDLANHKGPSTPMSVELCAGIAGSEALKILLHRGKTIAAPWGLQFDAYRNKCIKTWRPWGNENPIQKLALKVGRKKFGEAYKAAATEEYQPESVIEKILDLARWAPSGDNTQPWRFKIISPQKIQVHGFDTRDKVVYDLQGHASQISLGALLESIEVAASRHNFRAKIIRDENSPEDKPIFNITFTDDNKIRPNSLAPYIPLRTVQRRNMSTRKLTNHKKRKLEQSLPEGYNVLWLENFPERLKMANLLFFNAKLRLTIPEAYEVHKDVIEWNTEFSNEGLPQGSIGIDPLTAKIMHWTMQSWDRVEMMNRYFAGTLAPRVLLDFIPSIACGAHFVIYSTLPATTIDHYVDVGRCVQRFWLTATQNGLNIQPQYTPIVFQEYVREGITFSDSPHAWQYARQISEKLTATLGDHISRNSVYMGRIGAGKAATSRSLRLPLDKLIIS